MKRSTLSLILGLGMLGHQRDLGEGVDGRIVGVGRPDAESRS